MKSRFEIAKDVFVDSVDLSDYIELGSSQAAYRKLESSIDKPLKMVLLFGKPGTGKSILLNRITNQLKYKKEIYYFDTPATTQKEFFHKIFKILTKKELPSNAEVNFAALVEFCKGFRGKREIVILLDEAQMYDADLMEKIRLLSDSRAVKFIVSLHKTEDEDLIAKEHFQSRIWEVIELKNANIEELSTYIHKKLLKQNLFEVSNAIREKSIKLIHQYTGGNFRECNKLMYTIFEICEYYDLNEPHKLNYTKLPVKIVEMAALKLGYLNA